MWIEDAWQTRTCWGDRKRLEFPAHVGWREVINCSVPDLDLFPEAFGARTVRFRSGMELQGFNLVLRGLAALRRLRLLPSLERLAPLALRLSLLFYERGSRHGALSVWARGRDWSGGELERGRASLHTGSRGSRARATIPAAPWATCRTARPGCSHCVSPVAALWWRFSLTHGRIGPCSISSTWRHHARACAPNAAQLTLTAFKSSPPNMH